MNGGHVLLSSYMTASSSNRSTNGTISHVAIA